MKIISFAASSSTQSINKKLVTYAASLVDNSTVEILDLNDYEMPLFSQDRENELGHLDLAKAFLAKIESADAVMISFAEHNGTYTAAYKNLFDWCSRINAKVYQKKPMVLLSTSPGAGGAGSVLKTALSSMPFFDGDVKGSFSLPKFYENFDSENNRVSNNVLALELQNTVNKLKG